MMCMDIIIILHMLERTNNLGASHEDMDVCCPKMELVMHLQQKKGVGLLQEELDDLHLEISYLFKVR